MVDLKIIVALPGLKRKEEKGRIDFNAYTVESLKQEMDNLLEILAIDQFEKPPYIAVCFNNHAKIIGTENILYVGSANYSEQSYYNAEAGVLIRDKQAIQNIYSEFIDQLPTVHYDGSDWSLLLLSIDNCACVFECYIDRLDDLKNHVQFYEDMLYFSDEFKDYLHIVKDVKLEELRNKLKDIGDVGNNVYVGEFLDKMEEMTDNILENNEFWEILQPISDEMLPYDFNGLYREECGLPYDEPGHVEYISEEEMFRPLYEQYPEEYFPIIEDLWSKYYGNNENVIDVLNQLYAFISDKNKLIRMKQPDFEDKFKSDVVMQGSNSDVPK